MKTLEIDETSKILSARESERVVSLWEELQSRGYTPLNDFHRDLYVVRSTADAYVLFEVKTDASPSHIYSAIGQLLVYSLNMNQHTELVVVAPDPLHERWRPILARIGISCITYEIRERQPSFYGLADLLDEFE